MHYYRLTLRRRILRVDLDDLVKAAKRRKAVPPAAEPNRPTRVLLALGDLQLGKMDGDGVEGTVERFVNATAAPSSATSGSPRAPRST
jgi:hypothetical protein